MSAHRFGRLVGLVAVTSWLAWVGLAMVPALAHAQEVDADTDVNAISAPEAAIPVAGHWSGTINDSVAGPGTLDLLINQSGKHIRGSFDASFSDSTEDQTGALKKGIVSKTGALSFTLKPNSQKACSYTANAVLISSTEFTGNYAGNKFCSNKFGSFDVIFEHL